MAAEHDVRKFFATDETQRVVNVSIERGRVDEMGPLAKTLACERKKIKISGNFK